MAEYNLVDMARAYYAAYKQRDELWSRRSSGSEFGVPDKFEELHYSERVCIKYGLMAAVRLIDPKATFLGSMNDAELQREFAPVLSGAPDEE